MPSLDKRVSSARREVDQRRSANPLDQLERAVGALDPIRPFTEAIVGEEISFVLRVKQADRSLLGLAEESEVAGLAASIDPLAELSGKTPLPMLLTDIIVDAYQLYECRLAGAGGVVLIAAAFDDERRRDRRSVCAGRVDGTGRDRRGGRGVRGRARAGAARPRLVPDAQPRRRRRHRRLRAHVLAARGGARRQGGASQGGVRDARAGDGAGAGRCGCSHPGAVGGGR